MNFNGGSLQFDNYTSSLNFTNVTNLTLAAASGARSQLNGAITGSAGLTYTGSGTLILDGANSYTGATAIDGGTLQAGSANAFGNTSGVTVDTGGIAQLSVGTLATQNVLAGSLAGSTGTFVQAAGSITLSGNGGNLTLGSVANSLGDYSLSGAGLLTVAGTEYVGQRGAGTFTQSGGTNTVNNGNSLFLGNNIGSTGTYILTGGSLTTGYAERVGEYGAGTFNQTGGTNTAVVLSIGDFGGSTGAYTLSGSGSLTTSQGEYIGDRSGTGNFNQSGGANTLISGGSLILGNNVGSTGTYILSGGFLTSAAPDRVGEYGAGVFNQSGGSNTAASLSVGDFSGATGAYALSGFGTVTTSQGEYIGDRGGAGAVNQSGGANTLTSGSGLVLANNIGSTGTYTLSGSGSLAVSGSELVGLNGPGTFNQSGGTNSAGYFQLGNTSGTGTFTLSGSAALSVNGYEDIAAGGTGTFIQTGGSNSTGGIDIGYIGSGSYTQTAGTLTITHNDLDVGYSAGAAGSYSLISPGSLSVNGNEYVGINGTGTFVQTSGSNMLLGFVWIGANSGSKGTFLLHGGTLNTGDIRTDSGNGVFTMDGGSVNFTNHWIRDAINQGSVGNYTITAGTVTNDGGGLITVGESGTGQLNIGGNAVITSVNPGNHLMFGWNATGIGTVHVYGNASLDVWDIRNDSGQGIFTQDGGTVTANGYLHLGINSGASGTYTLNSGVTNLNEMADIGEGGTGTLNINGGSMTVVQDMNLGLNGAGGAANMAGGSLVIDGNLFVGNSGTGTFTQTGGASHDYALYLGLNTGSVGTYSLSGSGTLSVTNIFLNRSGAGTFMQSGGSVNAISVQIGMAGKFAQGGGASTLGNLTVNSGGTFSQTGGTNLAGYVTLDGVNGPAAAYSMSDGTLSVSGDEIVGQNGSATFTQTGGSAAAGSLYLGYYSSGNGTYSLSSSGMFSPGNVYVGYSGSGTLTQTGGLHTIGSGSALFLGYFTNSSGAYSLSAGGTLGKTGTNVNEYVGYSGTGAFTQTGGTNIAASLYLGYNTGSTGSYSLSGTGTLSVANLQLNTAGSGTFTQSGGSLTATNLVVGAGDTFSQSGGTVSAGVATLSAASNLLQSGGSATFEQITGAGQLTINGARTTLAFGGLVSQVAGITVQGTGVLDIANNILQINYGGATDPSATIRAYLKSASNGGLWTGPGLTSSTVAAQVAATIAAHGGGVYGIGYVDGGIDLNQPNNAIVKATGNQIIYTAALIGDANLDGSVTFIDLGIVAQNLGAINDDWEHGDFNYDGTTNFLDIGLLAQNLSKTVLNTPLDAMIADPSAALTAQWNLAVAELRANETQPANLPEPGMIGLLAIGAGGLMARRRRRA